MVSTVACPIRRLPQWISWMVVVVMCGMTFQHETSPAAHPHADSNLPNFSALLDGVVSLKVERRSKGSGRVSTTMGSGFVIDERGTVVTCSHVVRDASRVRATFSDGETASVKVVADDSARDVALLEIESSKPHLAMAMADRASVHVGSDVWVIGNPLGHSHSVTRGIVSAMGRQPTLPGVSKRPERGYLQTDAVVLPGNSGGPLVDRRGRVVGMIVANHGDVLGIAFALPSDALADILKTLSKTDIQASHPSCGDEVQP